MPNVGLELTTLMRSGVPCSFFGGVGICSTLFNQPEAYGKQVSDTPRSMCTLHTMYIALVSERHLGPCSFAAVSSTKLGGMLVPLVFGSVTLT